LYAGHAWPASGVWRLAFAVWRLERLPGRDPELPGLVVLFAWSAKRAIVRMRCRIRGNGLSPFFNGQSGALAGH
jgi:hypothetical protein